MRDDYYEKRYKGTPLEGIHPHIAQHMNWCRNYDGLARFRDRNIGARCKAGVLYDDVKGLPHGNQRYTMPCFQTEAVVCGVFCPHQSFPTREEAEEQSRESERAIAEWSRKLANDICPNCDAAITAMDQVGRCVYARPCGHRLYQGTVPERFQVGQREAVAIAQKRLDEGW